MDQLETLAAEPEFVETRPWWHSKLNLGAVALAIAVLCGALGWPGRSCSTRASTSAE